MICLIWSDDVAVAIDYHHIIIDAGNAVGGISSRERNFWHLFSVSDKAQKISAFFEILDWSSEAHHSRER